MKPKKSLGQNFLKSKEALRDIIAAAEITNTDTVLEIGPGKGILTEKILELAGHVVAIEKDESLVEFLKEKFQKEIEIGKLELISADVLAWNVTLEKYKLVANIPYYITGQIFRKFLEGSHQPSRMVLLVQKEVAERIVARDGKESILSMSVKAFGTPKYKGKVAAKYFSPEPKVDSAILLVENISKNFFTESKISEEIFFKYMKAGFAHKRKILAGNLHTAFPEMKTETVLHAFQESAIPEKARAEDISLEQWGKLIGFLR